VSRNRETIFLKAQPASPIKKKKKKRPTRKTFQERGKEAPGMQIWLPEYRQNSGKDSGGGGRRL